MDQTLFDTPILLVIFNRPDTTAKVMDVIRQLRPKYLYVAADGPRSGKESDHVNCDEARKTVLQGIDWDCEYKTLFREGNLGCGEAVSGAITWFFEHVEQGIILEDDTLPDPSFFDYCKRLLNHYKDDETVMHISGSDYASVDNYSASYYFSKLPFIWGWATWRRAWNKYKFNYKYLPLDEKLTILQKNFSNPKIVEYWYSVFAFFHLTPASFTWDFQWFLTIWDHNGLVIQPVKNLVQNIGFSEAATHTVYADSHLAKVKAQAIDRIKFNDLKEVDGWIQDQNFNFYFLPVVKEKPISWVKRIKGKGKKIIKNILGINPPQAINGAAGSTDKDEKYKAYPPFSINNAELGKFTYVSANSAISDAEIGKFCSIGPNFLCGWGIHPKNGISTNPMFYSTQKQNGYTLSHSDKIAERSRIHIGNDVFIGANVTVLDGVKIGDGAIVGAGAVVVNDIPPYAIAGGVPARIIGYRFDQEIIDQLLKIQWWDWPEEKLYLVEKYFFNLPDFIALGDEKL